MLPNAHGFGAALLSCEPATILSISGRAPLGLHTWAPPKRKQANLPATSPVPRPSVALAGPLTSDSWKRT